MTGGQGALQLRIYDTLRRELLPIQPRDGKVLRIYCCGPTVYRDAHVGNLRTFLLTDIARRTLEYLGYETKVIQNITDVGHMSEDFEEDKVLAQSVKEKRDPFEIAREYEMRFHRDSQALNIKDADLFPRASETIDLMHEIISKLIADGLAYVGEDHSVYFAAEKFASYGELSGNRLDALKPGHRYEYTEGGAKRFHADWALWKSAGNRKEMTWESPWGRGFPGWHIECTAMSLHFLGGHVDLHIGGIDLRFPHHENERAQSNSITGDEAVSAWLHGEHLLFEGRKMSKSAGNVVLVSDVVARGIDPLAIRFCFLENRYRSQMDLSWQSLSTAHTVLKRWRRKYQEWKQEPAQRSVAVEEFLADICRDFCDDLDTPRAMIKLRSIEKDERFSPGEKRALFESIDLLVGLELTRAEATRSLTPAIEALLEQRVVVRAARDFAASDRLRDELAALGISVRDTQAGQEWEWVD